MIDALGLLIREGLGLVVASMLPLFAVAAIAAILIGLVGGGLGIRDAALGQIVRVLAIVLALGVVAETIATGSVEFALRAWSSLAEVQAR